MWSVCECAWIVSTVNTCACVVVTANNIIIIVQLIHKVIDSVFNENEMKTRNSEAFAFVGVELFSFVHLDI